MSRFVVDLLIMESIFVVAILTTALWPKEAMRRTYVYKDGEFQQSVLPGKLEIMGGMPIFLVNWIFCVLAVFGVLGEGGVWAVTGFFNVLGMGYIMAKYVARHIVLCESSIQLFSCHKGYEITHENILVVNRKVYKKGLVVEKMTIYTDCREVPRIKIIKEKYASNALSEIVESYITRNLTTLDADVWYDYIRDYLVENIDPSKLVGFDKITE